MAKAKVENPTERDAMLYLEDQAYTAMLGYKEPVRSAEIIGAIGKDYYSSKLLRHILSTSERFAEIDRRWDLEIRYEDKQRPLKRVLKDIVAQYGQPLTAQQVANELASIYERPADYYESLAAKMLADEEDFFEISDGLFGLSDWVLIIESDSEEDVIFDNGIDEKRIAELEKAAAKVNWQGKDIAKEVAKMIDAAKSPVENIMIEFFSWRALGEEFNSAEIFGIMHESPEDVLLSDGRWASKKMIEKYDSVLTELADKLVEELAEEMTETQKEKSEIVEDVAPTLSLNISERDLDEVAQIISAKDGELLPAILESIFEISPREPIYAVAAEGLSDAMRADSRFVWLGGDRWQMAENLPDFAKEAPPQLAIQKLEFVTPEGESLEVELEDDGLEGALSTEIRNPLVQDVGDMDEITEQDELPTVESARCVLTRHHWKIGTFPLAQIPHTFFPLGPSIIQATFVEDELRQDVWINRELGLIYGMEKFYEGMPESGAVFELLKTEKPDEFELVYKENTEPLVFLHPGRIEELEALAEEAENMPTFDLMSRLMQAHRKGVPYVTLHTEINVVRRTSRRLVASILSAYYAFYQRPKSALWYFDEKKADQGFKKAKKKYIRKD